MAGYFPGFFEVWYNKDSMVNILSFSDACKKYRITFDMDIKVTTNVHLKDRRIMKFEEVESGVNPFASNKDNITNKPDMNYSFLNLVSINKAIFTRQEIDRDKRAWDVLRKLGLPEYQK